MAGSAPGGPLLDSACPTSFQVKKADMSESISEARDGVLELKILGQDRCGSGGNIGEASYWLRGTRQLNSEGRIILTTHSL